MNQQAVLGDKTKKILTSIHDDVYLKINEKSIDVFLCGGASSNSVRNRIRDLFPKNIRVMYPEDLFIEILNKDRESNLLTLEKFLAENCDVICIICESAGSLVELGAFTNNVNTENKVVAVVEQTKAKNKSFVMLGPVKFLQKKNRSNVVIYQENDIESLVKKLRTSFKSKLGGETKKNIESIVGLYYFIPMLLYFYTSLNTHNLAGYIKFIFEKFEYKQTNFDTLFKSSLKLLYKDKMIEKTNNIYCLTENGYKAVNKVFSGVKIKNKSKLYDSIRFAIISTQYYK